MEPRQQLYGIELLWDASTSADYGHVAGNGGMPSSDEQALPVRDRLACMRACASRQDDISQSIKRIISTRPGTLPISNDFGCRLHELLFRPLTPAVRVAMRYFVEAAITRWEKRIQELNVLVGGELDSNAVHISVAWRADGQAGIEHFATVHDGSGLTVWSDR